MSIVELMLDDLRKRLAAQHIRLELSDDAKNHIVDCGYDPSFGARPLRRFIQSRIETLAAKKLIGGHLEPGDTISIELEDGVLTAN